VKRANSLRRRLVRWLLPSLLLLLVINGVLSYRGALDAVNHAFDRSLAAAIRSIAERVYSLEGNISVDVPYAVFSMAGAGVQERIFYAVIAPDGKLITGYDALTAPDGLMVDAPPRIVDSHYRDESVRVGAMKKQLYDPALTDGDAATIVFAETTESRAVMARELFLDNLMQQLLLLALGTVMLTVALSTAFRPLLELRDAIRKRRNDDLTPIDEEGIPTEVRPLIDAINHHSERLSGMLMARRRFLADAAHQIRTPLAVLGTQAEYGQRQDDPAEMRDTFAGLIGTIRSTRRMADQMLALSQVESVEWSSQEPQWVDISRLARDVALELAPEALKKGIELAFEDGGEACINGNAQMFHELITNLLDNAIRYSPRDTEVVIATGVTHDAVLLRVSDHGPGIPLGERDKVFQRFYRILGHSAVPGSGLGLAIVHEIVLAYHGTITLDEQPGGHHGLIVVVKFPCDRHAS
jgi:two-component system sensor histidine kinase TctE